MSVEGDDRDRERAVRERIAVGREAHRVAVAAVAAIADRIFRAVLHDQRRQDSGRVLPGRRGPHHCFEGVSLTTQQVDRVFDAHRHGALLPARTACARRTQAALLCRSDVCCQSDGECRCARAESLQFPLTELI